MTDFTSSIEATILLGIAGAMVGCAHTGMAPGPVGAGSTTGMVVPEKYGLVEQHFVDVGAMQQQQKIVVRTVYSLASVDAIENSPHLKGISRLTDYKGAYEADYPDVSSDGNSLVFQLRGEDGNINLWTMSAKSGLKTVRKTNDAFLNFYPTFASKGARIIFCSNRANPSDLWALGAGGRIRRVTDSQDPDMWAHEDPVGQAIVAFTRFQLGDSRGEIWVYNRNSYLATQLREGRQPRISPDGKMIAFAAFDPQDEHWNVWVMNIDGSNATRLTKNNWDNLNPAWHPSGRWVIYESNDGAAIANLRNVDAEIKLHNFDIWMTDINGKQAFQLTVNGSDDRSPVFAAEGNSFYFSSNRGQAVDLASQDLQTYRAKGRTVYIGGTEFPLGSGRDIWRAELSQDLVAVMNGRSRHAGAQ